MASKWSIKTVGGYTGYTRVIRGANGNIKGSVWYEPSDRRYKWMASSRAGMQFGWSRTIKGAQRACSRAMHLMLRWGDAARW
jgi:hypothetical protein